MEHEDVIKKKKSREFLTKKNWKGNLANIYPKNMATG